MPFQLRNLGGPASLLSHFMMEVRDKRIQQDKARFRTNLARIGEILAYEISKEADFKKKLVKTSLGETRCQVIKEQPVIAAVLRAGLPFHAGFLRYFDHADSAFISVYRKHGQNGSFTISEPYVTCPSLDGRWVIITDPMLATGSSLLRSLEELSRYGKPARLDIASVIASEPGVEVVRSILNNVTLWTAAVDAELDERAFIVPGLGDAGDLAFGVKAQG